MAEDAGADGTERGRPHARPRNRALDITVFIAIIALAGIVVYISPYNISDSLLSPFGAFVAIVMVIEYLVLKSGDRTRAFRIENVKLREHRRRIERLLREAEAVLGEVPIEGDDPPPPVAPGAAPQAQLLR